MNPEEKHLLDDVKEKVKGNNTFFDDIHQDAENYAEEYVSSKLGYEDDNPRKKDMKNKYIDAYLEELRTHI